MQPYRLNNQKKFAPHLSICEIPGIIKYSQKHSYLCSSKPKEFSLQLVQEQKMDYSLEIKPFIIAIGFFILLFGFFHFSVIITSLLPQNQASHKYLMTRATLQLVGVCRNQEALKYQVEEASYHEKLGEMIL